MRRYRLPILIFAASLFAFGALAQKTVTNPADERFPTIQDSLDDGFYTLAEQQARGVLLKKPNDAEKRDATLLLAHALWGQKRYSEMLELLKGFDNGPGVAYWRARAYFELHQYDQSLAALAGGAEGMTGTPYAPAALRLKGRAEQLSGKLDAAAATYQEFAKKYPANVDAVDNQFDLAEVYLSQKHYADAQAVYQSLAKGSNSKGAQLARLKLAHVLYTTGTTNRSDEARTMLVSLATNDSVRLAYRIDAYVDLAALEEQAGHFTNSVSALRKGIALSPDANLRVPLKLSLARMLLRANDIDGALKLLEECRTEAPNESIAAELQLEKAGALLQAKRYKEADDAYQVYLDVANDQDGLAHAYFGKGLALWGLERYAESAIAFDKATKALTKPDEKAKALFKAGDAYYQANQLDDAEKRYRSFVVDYPNNKDIPNVLYQLGLVLAKIGRRSEALTTFGIIENSHPSSPFAEKAALRSADVMLASGQWEDALAKYTAIGQTYTNRNTVATSIHQQGIVLYQYLKRYADAQKAFEKILADYPDSEYAPQAAYMRGFCLYAQGKIKEGVDTCKAFIEKYPKSVWTPDVIFWLAEHYFNQGDYTDAEPLFLRIANDFKGTRLAPNALYWAGRSAAAKSDYVKANERYSEVAKTYPDSDIMPQTRFAQGDALTELGEFARATLAFEEIIKNYPDSDLVNAAWGRKGDCQFSLAVDTPARYHEAMNSYQAILDRPAAPAALKMQAEYKIGRCLEKTGQFDKAFSRYMNVVYTYISGNVKRSPYTVMWFTRSAFGAAALKENEQAWQDAVKVYDRVVEADVPAKEEAQKRIDKIKKDNWLLFQKAEKTDAAASQ